MKQEQFLILIAVISCGFHMYITAIVSIILATVLAFRK